MKASYRCRSTMYSEKYRVCRLSRFDQKDGRLIYDPDYDYYESLSGMHDAPSFFLFFFLASDRFIQLAYQAQVEKVELKTDSTTPRTACSIQ